MKTRLLYLLFFISSMVYSQIPTSGLQAMYEFIGGSFADAANAVNLTQQDSYVTNVVDRFGTANNAISLNGDSFNRANLSWHSEVSISFWLKTTTNTSDVKIIIDDRNSSDYGYQIYLKDGKVGFLARFRERHDDNSEVDSTNGVLSNKVIADGSWHHIVFTFRAETVFNGSYDSNQLSVKAFVDNEAAGTDNDYHSRYRFIIRPDVNTNIKIANNHNNTITAAEQYQDEIDEILWYNRAISSTEITQLATNNNFCFPLAVSSITTTSTRTSIDVSLLESGDYELAYVAKGQPIANATIIPLNGYIANTPQTISGLMPSNFYDIYVRSKCTASVWSNWSNAKTARTNGKIYVNASATGNNDGSSWVNAYTDLQDALAITVENQEIWIAKGTYKPDVSDRDASFTISKPNVKIYGGFAGTETDISQRDIANNPTIFSGDLNDDDTGVDFAGNNRADNSGHVVKLSKIGNEAGYNAYFNGITISGGHKPTLHSAAVLVEYSNIAGFTIENCIIKNNVASHSAFTYLQNRSTDSFNMKLIIKNSVIENNVSRYATIYMVDRRVNGTNSRLEVVNTLFKDNVAKDNGNTKGYFGSVAWIRGLASSDGSSTLSSKFVNCTLVNNKDLGTANDVNNFNRSPIAIQRNNNTITTEVSNCIFWGNEAAGGVSSRAISKGVGSSYGTMMVYNSIANDDFSNLAVAEKTNTSNSDPLFTDATNDDFTLQTTSPAKDTGDNTKLPTNTVTDLLGNLRIFNTTVDLGVYEFGATTPVTYTLTSNATNGSVTSNPSGNSFVESTMVELTATPDTGYIFVEWTGDETSTTNPVTITMDADKTVSPVFKLVHTITANASNGTITANPAGVNAGFVDGSTVTLTAVPDAGYFFSGWSGDLTGTTNPATLVMDADKTVTARFTATPVFVDINATGNNDGSSWADAFTDLQVAINNVPANKEIWVAEGVYKPTTTNSNVRKATFSITKKVKIYGSLPLGALSIDEQDITNHPTILSGDLNGNDNSILRENEPTRADNVYHVVTVKGNFGAGGFMNGFIITGGNANGILKNPCVLPGPDQFDDRVGGGVYSNPNDSGSKVYMTFKNCIVEKNTAIYNSAFGRFNPCGKQNTQSHIDFIYSIIRNNFSRDRETMAYSGSQRYNVLAYGKLINTLIHNNETAGASSASVLNMTSSGSISYPGAASYLDIINCTIVNNISPNNKAINMNMYDKGGSIYNTIIYNNGGDSPFMFGGEQPPMANNLFEGGQFSSINSDPMLNNDFTLQAGSLAIDSGDNNKLPLTYSNSKDLYGNDRIFNTTIDLGVFEYNPALNVDKVAVGDNGFINFYPNPVSSTIFIKSDSKVQYVRVYNLLGREVINAKDVSQIKVNNLPSGTYLIRIKTNEKEVSQKFIKR